MPPPPGRIVNYSRGVQADRYRNSGWDGDRHAIPGFAGDGPSRRAPSRIAPPRMPKPEHALELTGHELLEQWRRERARVAE